MRTLVIARNIINTEEIEAWLTERFDSRYPQLSVWINSVVRKWVIKKAPAAAVDAINQTEVPAWLRNVLEKGDPAENVVLGEALENKILPVLDYVADLVHNKPDTNLASMGFDVAEQRAIKWHKTLKQKLQTIEVVVEEGVNIIKSYSDGFSWRSVVDKEALVREGQLMGHCVGNTSYHATVIRGKLEIVSLRDADNLPHVTIEIGRSGNTIHQIKGKANGSVANRYLSYIEDFLKTRKWVDINFDKAPSIRESVLENQVFFAEPWFEFNGYCASLRPISQFGNSYVLFKKDDRNVKSGFIITTSTDGGPDIIRSVSDEELINAKILGSFLRELCVKKDVRIAPESMAQSIMYTDTTWSTSLADGWRKPTNDAGKKYALALTNNENALLCWSDKKLVAYYDDSKKQIIILDHVDLVTSKAIVTSLNQAGECISALKLFIINATNSKKNVELTRWFDKNLAGSTLQLDTDENLLNSLLTALKQPACADLKAAYLKLKTKTKITDAEFKQLGFRTGGRAIDAIALVLVCSLPLKNSAPFRNYIFHKPNTMTCWTEVLAKPDHLFMALATYGLKKDTIQLIIEVLRNEFLRLVPSDEEITELELAPGVETRLQQAIKYAHSHRYDKMRSKAIWGQL